MVAVEAMAAGTGVIAAGHGAFPELITAGSDGAIFAPTDVGGLVELIGSVDDDPDRWQRYGTHGRSTYLSRFTREVSLDRLIQIYRYAVQHPVTRSRRLAPRIVPASPHRPEVAAQ